MRAHQLVIRRGAAIPDRCPLPRTAQAIYQATPVVEMCLDWAVVLPGGRKEVELAQDFLGLPSKAPSCVALRFPARAISQIPQLLTRNSPN